MIFIALARRSHIYRKLVRKPFYGLGIGALKLGILRIGNKNVFIYSFSFLLRRGRSEPVRSFKAPYGRELSRKRLRESACSFRFASVIKRKRSLLAVSYKAPSGRELSRKRLREQACVFILYLLPSRREFRSQAPSVFCFAKSTSLPEGGLILSPLLWESLVYFILFFSYLFSSYIYKRIFGNVRRRVRGQIRTFHGQIRSFRGIFITVRGRFLNFLAVAII